MYERNALYCENLSDEEGNPAGGIVDSMGLSIAWQPGPLGSPPDTPRRAFVEDVLEAARQRLDFYQTAGHGRYACRENAIAITKIEEALMWLKARRDKNEQRGVQGLNKEWRG